MPTPTRSLTDRLIVPLRRMAARELPHTDAQLLGTFVHHRDPAAFEGIVRRHGPMVYGVCRRVVGHAPDADDAFQAVFVVLARRAAAVSPREKLADFLFGVAYRTALKAKARLARRRTREKQVDAMPEVAVCPPDTWADLQPVIDAELAALPEHLRLPVLLCDLEGRTQREAAAHLKLPPATLATRLTTARRKLAERLTARGITLAGGALAAVLTA
ncbi:MAG: RNA polymerase sigma factor, partial [Armatimonadaceae bacterium]